MDASREAGKLRLHERIATIQKPTFVLSPPTRASHLGAAHGGAQERPLVGVKRAGSAKTECERQEGLSMSFWSRLFGTNTPTSHRPTEPATTSSDETLFRAAFEQHMKATPEGQLRLAKHLLSIRPRPVHPVWGTTPLHDAMTVPVAQLFIDNGTVVDHRDQRGETPLHVAASSWNWTMVEYLVSKGAEVNAQDNDGHTALHFAVDRNCGWRGEWAVTSDDLVKTVDTLLAFGADAETRSSSGETACNTALASLRAIDSGQWSASYLVPRAFAAVAAKLGATVPAVDEATVASSANRALRDAIVKQQIPEFKKATTKHVEEALRLLLAHALLAVPVLPNEVIRELYGSGGFAKSWGSEGLQSGAQERIEQMLRKHLERFESAADFAHFSVNAYPAKGYADVSAVCRSGPGMVFHPVALWRGPDGFFVCGTAGFDR